MKRLNDLRRYGRLLAAPVALVGVLALFGCDEECDVVGVDRFAPAVPRGVYSVTGDELVTILWLHNTEPDLAGYNVYWRDAGSRKYALLATTGEDFYVDRGLQNGYTYYYAVTAFDLAGNESGLSEELFDTPRPEGFDLTLYNFELRGLGGNYLLNAYDFSQYRRMDYSSTEADIYFGHYEGLYLMYASDERTDVQDAGYVPLEDVNWAPSQGWSLTGTVELIPGHSYVVWTRTDNFAKFYVVELTPEFVVIDWAYQMQKGNPELVPPRRSQVAGGSSGNR